MDNKKPFDYSNLIAIIPGGLLVFALLCIFFNWTFLGNNAHAAREESFYWWIGGGVLLALSGFILIKSDGAMGKIILGGVILALSICTFCGFNFSIA